ncbi:MAG: hypothetical protein AMXMBFR48_26110 [Ignavibacteriales bacterium]
MLPAGQRIDATQYGATAGLQETSAHGGLGLILHQLPGAYYFLPLLHTILRGTLNPTFDYLIGNENNYFAVLIQDYSGK